jgi:hypothetical protein
VQETEYPEKTIYMLQITDKLDHIMLFHLHLALEGVRPYNAVHFAEPLKEADVDINEIGKEWTLCKINELCPS